MARPPLTGLAAIAASMSAISELESVMSHAARFSSVRDFLEEPGRGMTCAPRELTQAMAS